MEPVSATIAIIAAAKSAVETAQNIKDIGGSLEKLFSSHEGEEKKQKRKKATTRRQQVLRMRAGDEGYDDETSISAVANSGLGGKAKATCTGGAGKRDRQEMGAWDLVSDPRPAAEVAKGEGGSGQGC